MLTTRHPTGSPDWLDLGTPDPAAALAFYGALFGWDFRPAGPGTGGHGLFQLDGRTVAGGPALTPGRAAPAWTLHFRTADADATATAARDGGGTVLSGPADVPGLGRTALLADPAGARFAVRQPGADGGLERVGVPYALCWAELYTRDPAAAMAFYGSVLGLESSCSTRPGDTRSPLVLAPADGGDDASFGSLVPLRTDPVETAEAPYWTPVFEVPDADATAAGAARLGGTVRLAPEERPGLGRFAKLTDPQGARFAVVTGLATRA
ncbi:VOC family protein [Streptomyces sp. NPDC016309]|uniref:VOC family protein n=1 Tax=Streptomyces sp. NPDC016309 TaxID=3364965 RepID=UPI003701EF7A